MNASVTLARDSSLPDWASMWLLAIVIYGGAKLLTWGDANGLRANPWRSLAYLVLWPGMDGRAFLWERSDARRPTTREWLFAYSKFVLGVVLISLAAYLIRDAHTWLRAWVGMAGLAFVLHFGLFHILSCLWRECGVSAAPLMHWPIAATSVSAFWSRHWNLAFRDLTHRFLFRPLASRFGSSRALWLGFLASGLVHDAVISLPAHGGYGFPTLYFLLQAVAISIERSWLGKGLQLGRGVRGWLFTASSLLLPAPLLFHDLFQRNVVVPFLDAIASSSPQFSW